MRERYGGSSPPRRVSYRARTAAQEAVDRNADKARRMIESDELLSRSELERAGGQIGSTSSREDSKTGMGRSVRRLRVCSSCPAGGMSDGHDHEAT
jgi:hypothetical protein